MTWSPFADRIDTARKGVVSVDGRLLPSETIDRLRVAAAEHDFTVVDRSHIEYAKTDSWSDAPPLDPLHLPTHADGPTWDEQHASWHEQIHGWLNDNAVALPDRVAALERMMAGLTGLFLHDPDAELRAEMRRMQIYMWAQTAAIVILMVTLVLVTR